MSSVIVAGNTSGSVSLFAPDESGSTVLTLPTTTGTLVVNSGAQTIEFADGSASAPSITNSGDTNTGIFFPAADTIAFAEGGSEAMRIDSSGNLGLGVTPSAWRTAVGTKALQIGGSGALFSQESSGTYWTTLTSNAFQNTSNVNAYINTGFATSYTQTSGQHVWGIAPSGTAGNAITFTQAMTLDASGNLGIGVTPSAWGTNTKAIEFGGTINNYLAFNNSGVLGSYLYWNMVYDGTNNKYKYTGLANAYGVDNTGKHLWFNAPSGTAGNNVTLTQAMTLDAVGRLGLGTSSPTAKLHIKQGSDGFGDALRIEQSSVANYWDMVCGGDSGLYTGYKGDTKMVITSSGNVGIGVTPAGTGGCLQLKSGITFPATQSASTDANTLDDYEEGSWTPQIGGTTSGTKSVATGNAGWYRKVGTLVTCGGTLAWNSADALSGLIVIKNLPYVSDSTTGTRGGGVMGVIASGLATNGAYTGFQIVADPAATFAYIIQVNGSNYSHNPTVSNSGTVYGFCFSYISAS